MRYTLTEFLSLWFGSDYLIIALIIYSITACILDIQIRISERIINKFKLRLDWADIYFIHLLIIVASIIILDIQYDFVHLPILVDYVDGRLSWLRARAILYAIIVYAVLGISSSVLLVIKAKKKRGKWLLYGLFFNVLALLYFGKSNQK